MAANERTALLNGGAYRNGGTHIIEVTPLERSDSDEIFSDYQSSSGLSLDELLLYKEDPWWRNLRRALFCSFWLTLLLTFLAACGLSYLQIDKCTAGSSAVSAAFPGAKIASKIVAGRT